MEAIKIIDRLIYQKRKFVNALFNTKEESNEYRKEVDNLIQIKRFIKR